MTYTNEITTPEGFEPYEHVTTPNRYGGTCDCGAYVQAGDGFYAAGGVYCTQPGSLFQCEWLCEVDARREAKIMKAQRERSIELANRKYVPTEADLARYAKEAAENAAWEAQGMKRCKRCGGAGGSSHWPGWACYDCGGEGAVIA